jgi:chromosome segregation ATPase
MVRRQTANTRRTTPRKPEVHVVEGEAIEEAKQALDQASGPDHTETASADDVIDVLAEPWDDASDPEVAPEPVDSALESKVTDLKNSLEASHQKEQTLQQKVGELQTQLDEQKSLAKSLQTSLEKASKIQSELEQAQKAALQLAESNQKLIDENKALKTAQTQVESSKKASQLALQPSEDKKASQLSIPPEMDGHDRFIRQQAANHAHPVFPNDPMPSRLTEQDIGWFD